MASQRPQPSDDALRARPAGGERPHHVDSVLESMGKAITDAVREAAGEVDGETREARHKAQPDAPSHPDQHFHPLDR